VSRKFFFMRARSIDSSSRPIEIASAASADDGRRLSGSIRLYDNCDLRRSPVFIDCGAFDRSLNNQFQKPPQESFMPQ
jgi:hypothetical protein